MPKDGSLIAQSLCGRGSRGDYFEHELEEHELHELSRIVYNKLIRAIRFNSCHENDWHYRRYLMAIND